MKRVKVMLMAIAVIALAAGTLAFKARYSLNFCTTTATTTIKDGQQVYTCTTTVDGEQTTLACPNITSQKFTAENFPTVTVCTTAPTTTTVNGPLTCLNRICDLPTTKITVE